MHIPPPDVLDRQLSVSTPRRPVLAALAGAVYVADLADHRIQKFVLAA